MSLLTRYESIVQACLEELDRQKAGLNADPHLRSVQVVVELDRGSVTVSVSLKSSRPRARLPSHDDARNFVPDQP